MNRRLLPILLMAALPLAACDRAPAPAVDEAPGPAAAAPASTLPDSFVVLTNEPFWQARVEDGEVVLSGPGAEDRRFSIDTVEDSEAARVVHASDGAGTISVRLTAGPCVDSMAGAEFPQAGELTIDGIGPVPGCARPADMPPPGEPGA